VPRITDARKAEVRNQLIDAAVEVLLAEGPAGVTSRRILEQAGLSAGALYHYFASLDELYEAVAVRFTRLGDPLFAVEVGQPAGEDGAVLTLADVHVAVMRDLFGHGDQVLLGQLRSIADTNGGVRRALQHYDRMMVEQGGALNRASQASGLFRDDADAEALVEVIGTFFEGFNVKSRATGFATSRERVLRLFLEMLTERLLDDHRPEAAELRRRIEEISEP
jgi:AcrR family transcriptional regulator